MLFVLIQLSLILFAGKVFASYESSCTSSCDLPGLICVNGRCYCDWNQRLFWTGSRCLSCPVGWMLTGTRCVNHFQTKMTWGQALAICQQYQADIISFRDSGAYSLVYQVTSTSYRRRKRVETSPEKTIGWTSAHAIEFDNLGLYRWTDTSLPSFNSKSSWWCKQNTPGFTPSYPVNEPTRLFYGTIGESCTIFHRGTTSTAGLCLDDVYCEYTYPFICERSEATAHKYLGPPPSTSGISDGGAHVNTDGGGGSHHSTGISGSTENTGSHGQSNHQGASSGSIEPQTKKKSNTIIITIIPFVLLLLVGILVGVWYFMKRRNTTGTEHPIGARENKINPNITNTQRPIQTDTNLTDVDEVNELPNQTRNSIETGLQLNTDINRGNLGFNIGNQKQMKNKRGGYSKQQFENEFE